MVIPEKRVLHRVEEHVVVKIHEAHVDLVLLEDLDHVLTLLVDERHRPALLLALHIGEEAYHSRGTARRKGDGAALANVGPQIHNEGNGCLASEIVEAGLVETLAAVRNALLNGVKGGRLPMERVTEVLQKVILENVL